MKKLLSNPFVLLLAGFGIYKGIKYFKDKKEAEAEAQTMVPPKLGVPVIQHGTPPGANLNIEGSNYVCAPGTNQIVYDHYGTPRWVNCKPMKTNSLY